MTRQLVPKEANVVKMDTAQTILAVVGMVEPLIPGLITIIKEVHDEVGGWPTTPEEIEAFQNKVIARWHGSVDAIHGDIVAWRAAHPNA